MSTFSDVLTEYINTKNIKVFPMAKYCGLDRSTMYKLISGKRNPPPRDILKKMILFMHLTPTEAQHLEEAWNVTRIGPEIYYKRKSVEISSAIFQVISPYLRMNLFFLPKSSSTIRTLTVLL